jgi:NAD(P)-dependent dehydrogenase (short-subunit alcohol dehydrogenase family)
MDIAGKTIIVTGGGGGIGGATAVLLAERGAAVVLVDRDETAAKDVLEQLTPGSHRFVDADVSDPEQITGIFDLISAEGRDFAGVINAAGIVSGGLPWPASDLGRMRTVIEVNANLAQHARRAARRQWRPDRRQRGVCRRDQASSARPRVRG